VRGPTWRGVARLQDGWREANTISTDERTSHPPDWLYKLHGRPQNDGWEEGSIIANDTACTKVTACLACS